MAARRVAIVHYHLRRGGVQRVIERAVQAATPSGLKAVVLVGERPDDPGGLDIIVDEALAYDGQCDAIDDLADRLTRQAADALGGPVDLWHVHNHCLGKNAALPLLAPELARRGERLLLQIHDFAEDGRPGNYRVLREALADDFDAALYPSGPNVRYALLNSRDVDVLRAAGAGGTHLLPNAAPDLPLLPPPSDDRLLVYPTRAIRRKNVGECLLLAAAAKGRRRFSVTLVPKNPAARTIYDGWVALGDRHGLPVEWGAGEDRELSDVMAPAGAALTTSVAEGFGLCFLEPWMMGRAVVGRDLPEITGDFTRDGVDLSGLYDRLDVPAEWVDPGVLREKVSILLAASYQACGRPMSDADVDAAMARIIGPDGVDFGCLDEDMQTQVIQRVLADSDAGDRLYERVLGAPLPNRECIEANRQAIRQHYGLDVYGQQLMELYDTVMTDHDGGAISAASVLDAFLRPERFRMLRTS